MTGRHRRGARRAAGVAVLGLALLAAAALATAPQPAPATQRTPPAAHPDDEGQAAAQPASVLVAQHIVDAAVLPADGGRTRVLTVSQDDTSPGRVRLAVLERAGGRWSEAAANVDEPRIPGQTRTPWLVQFGDGRYVLLTLAPALEETWLRTVTWTRGKIALGPRIAVGRQADAAGAADVDGDGRPELVFAETPSLRTGPFCQGSRLVVMGLPDLRQIAEHRVQNLRLGPGALGELDATPGADLVAATWFNCPAAPPSPDRLTLVGVRLRDGEVLTTQSLSVPDPFAASVGRPAIVDADGDGRAEVLVGGRGLLVLEPRRAWRTTVLPAFPGVLLGAVGRSSGAHAAMLDDAGVSVARVARDDDGWEAMPHGRVDAAIVDGARIEGATIDTRSSAAHRAEGATWLDGPASCPTLVVSLAVLRCDNDESVVAGPAWLGTRPVARLTSSDGLLVAQTDVWSSVPARLVSPSPLATESTGGAWRYGPSDTFSLVEVAASAFGGTAETPPVPEPFAARDGPSVRIAAAPGSRLVAALTAVESEEDAATAERLARLLAVRRRSGWTLSFVRVPEAGAVHLGLPAGPSGAAGSWSVEVASIGPMGDVSPVVRAAVALDTAPPALAVDDAFLRVPWPLTTALTGTTEPGVTVEAAGGSTVAEADGRFRLPVRLAPWPQRVEVRATDAAGNGTPVVADVVGGPDLRRLPWALILATVLVAGAALGGLAARRRPTPAGAKDGPAIEELESGDRRRAVR